MTACPKGQAENFEAAAAVTCSCFLSAGWVQDGYRTAEKVIIYQLS